MQFLTSLFRRHIKGLTIGAVVAFLPKAFGWVAEQWFGNRVGEAVDKMLCLITLDVFKVPFLWMAAHPIQSVVYTTCALVGLFSIETKFYERREREHNPNSQSENQSAAEQALASAKKAISDAMPPKLGAAPKKDLPLGKVVIDPRNHLAGILIAITQRLDLNRSFTCYVSLSDIKKLDTDGSAHSVAEFHDKDGNFRFTGVRLNPADGGGAGETYYNAERVWWLLEGGNNQPHIRHWIPDGNSRGTGMITIPRGSWRVALQVTLTNDQLGTVSISRYLNFIWDGTKVPYAT